MTEKEQELLIKYRKYVRKKRIFVLFIVLLIIGSASIGSYYLYLKYYNPTNKEIIDTTVPILELTHNEITINQNDVIEYTNFIKSAYDDIDGDIIDNVTYNEIDTSIVGEQKIIFKVKDKALNEAHAELLVIINEIEEETAPSNEETQVQEETAQDSTNTNNNTSNTDSSSNSNSSNSNSSSNNTSSNNDTSQNPTTTRIVKDFLFTDGYNMNSVVDACNSELQASGRSGMCEPITDSKGIYLGMRLTLE